jgi:hypothetical protein
MSKHADQLLARSFEEELSAAERMWLAAHLDSCRSCRDLERELNLAEERLERQEVASDVPARPERRPSGSWRNALVLAGAAAIVVSGITLATLRAELPVATAAPSTATPSRSAATAAGPRVVFVHSVVLDTIPGGGAVTTDAYDSFEVLAPGGTRQSHQIAGVAVGRPVFDGRERFAYWRRASITRPSGTISGAYEVVVWDVRSDRERVLLTLGDERSNGSLFWTADRKSVVVPTRTTTGTAGATQNGLLLFDADTGATRALLPSGDGAGVGPFYVDAQVIVGVRGSSYVVLDAASGAVRGQTPLRVVTSFLQQYAHLVSSPDGTVLELHRRFESEAGPLWIWSAKDPGTDLAKVDERGISDPIFWPGRSEVVFSGLSGLSAVDYGSGRTRPLVSPPGVRSVIAVESGGRFALVGGDAGLQIVERVDDELRARPDLQLTVGPTLTPLGVVFP